MLLSLLILLILLGSFFIGLRRGFILQLVHLVSLFIALFVAFLFYDDVAEFLRLWLPYPQFSDQTDFMFLANFDMESVYYAGISFAVLFLATKIILQIIGSMLDFLAQLPILHTVNRLLGGILGFIETYLLLFILLIVTALIPVPFAQEMIADSTVARVMIEHTPILSEWLQELWQDVPFDDTPATSF
ncbi:CvpA family protein [Salsuginibacillus kocurii]|uniref:CvpA family protein n=1 Tax=Salsuginibacillus kocurii TaxID=427078 RepID=UPI000380351E|nr:CvpA family protein [Salsuginibacillus kocurii]